MAELGDRIAGALSGEPDIEVVYLFGSSARGEAMSASDVDVALLCTSPVELMRLGALQERLAERLGREVDLVDLKRASPLLAAEIVREGQAVMVANPTAKFDFELAALQRWEDTRNLRRQQQDLLRERARRGRPG